MKDKIVDIEGKKFLMNFSDNSFLEIVDYNEPKINTLTPFSYIDTEETKSYFGDINYGKEKKKWGCINERNEVVIPCVYDNIDVCNGSPEKTCGLCVDFCQSEQEKLSIYDATQQSPELFHFCIKGFSRCICRPIDKVVKDFILSVIHSCRYIIEGFIPKFSYFAIP